MTEQPVLTHAVLDAIERRARNATPGPFDQWAGEILEHDVFVEGDMLTDFPVVRRDQQVDGFPTKTERVADFRFIRDQAYYASLDPAVVLALVSLARTALGDRPEGIDTPT